MIDVDFVLEKRKKRSVLDEGHIVKNKCVTSCY